ncbi:hypothetical protein QYE76_026337 [Lolium multiflorum]|uniref:F-box domain-containing protein n=1 Tax=Lolium multiflorum TaxID=4521 RepID=A0AAD8RG11_LOLMU|nr:hypothetical protein QYE76_026337 [Lolium multiflorum]
METPAACEIERLPKDLLVHVISLTSPGDAFRATAVSRAFHAAADSDTVWSRFLPSDLPRFAKKELPRTPPSTKKGLFRRLSDEPMLLPHKFMRMQLDKATGAKCFTLSASALQIPPYTRRGNWTRVGSDFYYNKRGKRFLQAVVLGYIQGLDIRAKVQRKMLSQNTTYVAYMVFKLPDRFYGLDFPFQDALFGVAGSESVRQVCLQGYIEDGDRADEPPRKHILPSCYPTRCDTIPPLDDVHFPRKKTDGWMEVELGEFHNEGGDGEISISLIQTSSRKSSLIVWGIDY